MFRFLTAGESHGPMLTALIDGVPAGLPLTAEDINLDLARRQKGYGRGGRMRIEQDKAQILSGVRHGFTLGSPVAVSIENHDWASWNQEMAVEPKTDESPTRSGVWVPRPGHADLPGALKYGHTDMRNVLERASARETAARVAVGAVSKKILNTLGIKIASHVVSIGSVRAKSQEFEIDDVIRISEESEVRCIDAESAAAMISAIDTAKEQGETLGGIFEVIAVNLPVGLGTYSQWDTRLDGMLAQALMSIPAIKGVEIGLGFEAAEKLGSQVHDEIGYNRGYTRKSNNAGGLEGGITNGEPIVVRAAMKPIPTLTKQLNSVDVRTKTEALAHAERSDVCAVPAAAVVGEAMVAVTLVTAVLDKYCSDNMDELSASLQAYSRRE